MNISAHVKAFAILFLVGGTISCQQAAGVAEVAEPSASNFTVRMEVPVGTPGSMQYPEPFEGTEGVWFGEAQGFHLSYAGLSVDASGEPVIRFEIAHYEKITFSDLTEANIGQHMAIEVDGEVICAPILNDRLPGGGIIQGSTNDWDIDTANDLVYSLKTGGQKRE